jgi:hypothetical protein
VVADFITADIAGAVRRVLVQEINAATLHDPGCMWALIFSRVAQRTSVELFAGIHLVLAEQTRIQIFQDLIDGLDAADDDGLAGRVAERVRNLPFNWATGLAMEQQRLEGRRRARVRVEDHTEKESYPVEELVHGADPYAVIAA